MNKSIEQFIEQHRAALDVATPEALGWRGVEQVLTRLPKADALEQAILFDRPLLDVAEPSAEVWANIEKQLSPPKTTRTTDDALETFVRNHRDELDHATPDLRVWEQLAQTTVAPVAPMRVAWRSRLLRVAAAVALLVVGAGIGVWYAQQQQEAVAGLRLGDVSAEYAELEQHYERDISAKKEKLAQFTSIAQTDDIQADLDQMDKVMNELRQELANVPPANRKQVVRAMIDNYKAKTNILQRVLESLEQQQQQEQSRNGSDPSTTNGRTKHI
jgi:phosphoglycolate phosphatase-like HAD superfamily hydrolase